MLYPAIKDLLKNIDNRYLLVNVTAKRAREISDEAEENMEKLGEKPVKLAINEIAEGKLSGKMKEGIVSSVGK